MPPDDFVARLEPLRPAIRLHCYRMLGSSHDGEDVVQETMLRAWRAKDSLEDAARLKPWLYRIATNVCFDELKKRPRAGRLYAPDAYPPTDDPVPPLPRVEEESWLEPMPNGWLEGVEERSPEAQYELKESVALAFVAALQCLSPVQRAALLLRDVVGLSAAETAMALETSVDAANSALFRARTAAKPVGSSEVDSDVLAKYVRAFDAGDLEALVLLFHHDMRTTMPPAPIWVRGREANIRFYRRIFGAMVPGQIRHLPIGMNGQPALAFHRDGDMTAVDLVTTRDGLVSGVDHFMLPRVFPLFGSTRYE